GIRDDLVTGVQTCALPILARSSITSWQTEDEVPDDVALDFGSTGFDGISARTEITVGPDAFVNGAGVAAGQLAIGSQQFLGELRSEERRVGKEGRGSR